ncbi:hypothetical protein EDEG_01835 [Edhazardia aedis USNM 41457]|uniref:Uncharacterized protein n=1 Tax=Edhazardia aedis (strain USNM 41457) TaxID=1003232 RepID=J9DRB7_EDHAE|nr:hypothetical protein EDEG_01835 [Edhazardia aedis USNM 41457]|eukprot:EJW03882.1 hypothetical protein EDEG_01835 [Edhazardia aedis USNM 41457]
MQKVFRIFKFSLRITEFDKHENREKYKILESESQKIYYASRKAAEIINEEYLTFFSHQKNILELSLKDNSIKINFSSENINLNIITLGIKNAPHIRFIIKNKKLMLKYHFGWDRKMQISFYSNQEIHIFLNALSNMMNINKTNLNDFITRINNLSKNTQYLIDEKYYCSKLSSEDLKNMFIELVNLNKKN